MSLVLASPKVYDTGTGITQTRVRSADWYESLPWALYLPMDAAWKSMIGSQVQQRQTSIEALARHISRGNTTSGGALGEGPMMKAVQAEITPVGAYQNILSPSLLLSAPAGGQAPVRFLQPVRTDALFNVALKILPGWSMAAGMQTAMDLLGKRKDTMLDMQSVAQAHELKPLSESAVSLLYFCTPVGFASLFPVVCADTARLLNKDAYSAFLDANDAQPIGLGANEFCDTVCASLSAGYPVEEVQTYYSDFLDRPSIGDLSKLQPNITVVRTCDAFVLGLGLGTPSDEDLKASQAAFKPSSIWVLTGTLKKGFGAPQPRVRMVCPIPFIFHSRDERADKYTADRVALTRQLVNLSRYFGEDTEIFAKVPANWVKLFKWKTRVSRWIDNIAKDFYIAQARLQTSALSLTPEREVGDRCIPFATQTTVAHVVSDELVVETSAAEVLMASDVEPRANAYVIVVCGSTRIWKANSAEFTAKIAGKQEDTVIDLKERGSQYSVSAIDVAVDTVLSRLLLLNNQHFLQFDEHALGTAHCTGSLLPPVVADIDAWFRRDANIHMWLGNPNVSHFIDLALSMVQDDSRTWLGDYSVRLIDFLEVPAGTLASARAIKAVRTVSVFFGLLVVAAYQQAAAEQSTGADVTRLSLAAANVQDTRRKLQGLRRMRDGEYPAFWYLAVPEDGTLPSLVLRTVTAFTPPKSLNY